MNTMDEEKIQEKIERLKEVYFKQCCHYPTKANNRAIVKSFTKGPTGFQSQIKLRQKF